jgi:sugar phosphate isomerase/epimerase
MFPTTDASTTDRREFLKTAAMAAAGSGLAGALGRTAFAQLESTPAASAESSKPMFDISLAEWSLNRTIRSGEMDNLDFSAFAKNEFGIEAVEYVDQFFSDKAEDQAYMTEMKTRADDAGVKSLLIMIDTAGDLGHPDDAERKQSVERHHKWVEAAKFLGCHSIRVNARSRGNYEEQRDRAADGLHGLSEFAAEHDINVLVENHGGLSSNGKWLVEVMKQVDLPNCGTLPDFGNFNVGRNDFGLDEQYDRYQGVEELMPYAKAVSAKSREFDAEGNDVQTDFFRMMTIVLAAGYHGYVGIEWEGGTPGEVEGIHLTHKLLKRVRDELA